ncbi:hypothetical protein VNO80_04907 [Phaseolus coccineus]|uniref:Uncharacterized protein n=1 Tax=Phaseolus coccineus TaxID=3886 RepID=A0AAN9RNM5_PHACN
MEKFDVRLCLNFEVAGFFLDPGIFLANVNLLLAVRIFDYFKEWFWNLLWNRKMYMVRTYAIAVLESNIGTLLETN